MSQPSRVVARQGWVGQPDEPFAIDYLDFEHFSVGGEHRKATEQLARRLVSEADQWDEYIELPAARNLAGQSHDYPPGAVDLIVLSNFLTQTSMTDALAAELLELAESLTPGGSLLVLGSAHPSYGEIFSKVESLVTRSGRLRQVLDIEREAPHADPTIRGLVERQLNECLGHCRSLSPSAYDDAARDLPGDVREPGSRTINFPRFRAAAFKAEGRRPQGRWGRRAQGVTRRPAGQDTSDGDRRSPVV